jgi:hypothetical protein
MSVLTLVSGAEDEFLETDKYLTTCYVYGKYSFFDLRGLDNPY